MSGLIILLLVTVGPLLLLDLLAQRYGVDSRSESRDPRAPVRGITA